MAEKLLEVNRLHTYFFGDSGVVKAVEGVSFSVDEGETLGIVGESGCGKSVTALSVMRLLMDTSGRVVEGSVHFCGKNLVDLSEDRIRSIRGNEIAMVFQEPMTSLNPVLRIGEQIEEAVRIHLRYPQARAKEHVIGMLKSVGIPRSAEIYYEYPHQLSGGMRQRAMIAMAMSCHPKLLIADEPTTALDVTIQAQILNLMRKLKAETSMAIILITHDLAIVAEMCDRVAVMYCGRIIEEGEIFDIFETPKHPYTIGLHNSIPRMDQDDHRLKSIAGVVPSLRNMPEGCKFSPRCPQALGKCLVEEPPAFIICGTHYCKCWLYE